LGHGHAGLEGCVFRQFRKDPGRPRIIEEFRGIRDLNLDLADKNFGVCGPNGTGKSGVVDAIDVKNKRCWSRTLYEGVDTT